MSIKNCTFELIRFLYFLSIVKFIFTNLSDFDEFREHFNFEWI